MLYSCSVLEGLFQLILFYSLSDPGKRYEFPYTCCLMSIPYLSLILSSSIWCMKSINTTVNSLLFYVNIANLPNVRVKYLKHIFTICAPKKKKKVFKL